MNKMNFTINDLPSELHSLIEEYILGLKFNIIYTDGCSTKGYKNSNGKKHGNCKWWYPNGQIMYDFNYQNDKKHGNCKLWGFKGDLIYNDNYQHGKKHGNCKWWYENGQLEEEGEFK